MVVIEYRGTPADRSAVIRSAAQAVRSGKLVVLPTDTVYGVGCDPFNADAVERLLSAKGRGREKPSPVLVASPEQAEELAADIPDLARVLIERFWPGPLTVVLASKPLGWDLGETGGTVALRMPDERVALELLRAAGPMAVTSANLTSRPAASTAAQAARQLGEKVAVYIDAGECGGGTPSTVVGIEPVGGERSGTRVRIYREGAVAAGDLERFADVVMP
ncbi:MAG: L-threonylcarbamoyladenylate synthase [Actinomycetaceae bacterium]|nr:L-threonylcarbamoyladenylate synthase [Actinomycetaceae bacterium]